MADPTDVDREPWEIQGFHDGETRAWWSVPVTGPAGVLDYLTHALVESDAAVFLVRRGPQVDVYESPTVEPYRLLDMRTARDRLARHLYLASHGPEDTGGWAQMWESDHPRINKDLWRRKADAILTALLNGEPDPKETP